MLPFWKVCACSTSFSIIVNDMLSGEHCHHQLPSLLVLLSVDIASEETRVITAATVMLRDNASSCLCSPAAVVDIMMRSSAYSSSGIRT